MANFYTLLVVYSKVGKLYKLPYQCHIFWFQDLEKKFLYNFEGYTLKGSFSSFIMGAQRP